MQEKKKKDCFAQVDGFEQWMDTFFHEPYESEYCQHDLHIDLFETDTVYIIEAEISLTNTTHIVINKTQHSLTIHVIDSSHEKEKIIDLPIPIMDKKITAQVTNSLLEIHISKTTPSSEQTLIIACHS
ncbi:Hsp20/alpha crystallin family protein [Priestia taiwanensis]|uniref:Spore coat protein M n=1 Tax=Priestia taiwanensis TaxID=1347902 RepID=A0A917AP04_9BACI|nr:Hsp20/alpha crystallin family protein [Priestia taiwanensis]MBM7362541.1 HSP20 family molecular chaperone IbpA [Priestia taiwanensis]GGE63049.1 spore coat protein M [Priestia taiwanensis]